MDRVVYTGWADQLTRQVSFAWSDLDPGLKVSASAVDVDKIVRQAKKRLNPVELMCVLGQISGGDDQIVYCAVSLPGGVDGRDRSDKGGVIRRASTSRESLKLDSWTTMRMDVIKATEVAANALAKLSPVERLCLAGTPVRAASREEVEAAVLADYEAVSGRVVLVDVVECYNDKGDLIPVSCDPPAIARVEENADLHSDLLRWMDENHVDPVYSIRVLDPHPAFEQVRPSMIYGRTRVRFGESGEPEFRIADADTQARYHCHPGLDPDEAGHSPAPICP